MRLRSPRIQAQPSAVPIGSGTQKLQLSNQILRSPNPTRRVSRRKPIDYRTKTLLKAVNNIKYHSSRRRTFERWNRFSSLLVILFGATGFLSALTKFYDDQLVLVAAVTSVIGAVQLIYDFGGMARTHQQFQEEYQKIKGQIDTNQEPTKTRVDRWNEEINNLIAKEPPEYRAVHALAFNEAVDAIAGVNADQRLVIPFRHRLLKNFCAFNGYHYSKIAELKKIPEAPAAGGGGQRKGRALSKSGAQSSGVSKPQPTKRATS
ncbi:SLATT domain-containing protein [Sinorhizobium medicae]|nr:SLATT domain-containing protein [Sinorhizobium medicae]MQU79439.1 SLATT domain-containing protein [Sinorhizobium medicae]